MIIHKCFPHKEINIFGEVVESKSRYDYIIKKIVNSKRVIKKGFEMTLSNTENSEKISLESATKLFNSFSINNLTSLSPYYTF